MVGWVNNALMSLIDHDMPGRGVLFLSTYSCRVSQSGVTVSHLRLHIVYK